MVHDFHELQNAHSTKQDFKKIVISDKGTDIFIHPSDIIFIELHSNMHITYCYMEMGNHSAFKKSSAIRGTLADLEKILPPFFYRISRKCLLNTNNIEKIKDNEITLTFFLEGNKQMIKIMSKEKKKGLMELISLNG